MLVYIIHTIDCICRGRPGAVQSLHHQDSTRLSSVHIAIFNIPYYSISPYYTCN